MLVTLVHDLKLVVILLSEQYNFPCYSNYIQDFKESNFQDIFR